MLLKLHETFGDLFYQLHNLQQNLLKILDSSV